MLLLGKSVLCTYAIYVDGRGTYALGKRELSQVRSEGRAAELSFPPPPRFSIATRVSGRGF